MPHPVSLILTTHDRAPLLQSSIQSILNQTYPHFELILWDDGSTDSTPTIAHYYAQQDPRIRLFTAPHQGRAQALKSAHAQATGTYLAWVDSDDLLHPQALEATLPILNTHPQIGMVYTNYHILDRHNQIQGLGHRCTIPYSPTRLLLDFMTFHFRIFRRSLYDQIGGIDTSFTCAMDYDLSLKLSEVTQVYHLPQPLYFYRDHPHSISQARRLEQIQCSQRAVENALQRRGLSDRFELVVQTNPDQTCQFRLRRKSSNAIAAHSK
jgi:glycosyltransferase involved in cell wall biosynthesis